MKTILAGLFVCASVNLIAQDYTSFTQTIQKLYASPQQTWAELKQANTIPFAVHDSIALLYKGTATSVAWMGDFNGWGYDKKFNNKGVKIPNSDIWILRTSFPINARLDYKIILNGTDWILDPANIHQQWSGVGGGSPNSEIRMPHWQPDATTLTRDNIAKGTLTQDILYNSSTLGYQLTYSVYFPQGYSTSKIYPVVYVTDGYEYLHERMGNMKTILDNLIADKKIQPVVAILLTTASPLIAPITDAWTNWR